MRTIDAVFKDAFDKVTAIKSFGIGPQSVANVLEGTMPRVWVHNITSTDNVGMSGAIETTYNVLFDLSTYSAFGEELMSVRDKMQTLDAAWVKYLDAITQDSRLGAMPVNIRREEHYWEFDHSLIGFAISMQVNLREGLSYYCETVQQSYYNDGYIPVSYTHLTLPTNREV